MHEELRIVILKVKKCFESNESSCESGYSKNNQSYNAQGTFILKLVQSALQSSFARLCDENCTSTTVPCAES